MLDVDAITLDFFGTLVEGGEAALRKAASAAIQDHALGCTPDRFIDAWSVRYFAMNEGPFVTIAEANERSLRETLEALGAPPDAEGYVEILNEEWERVGPFPEVPEFLKTVEDYELCILSNVDDDFLHMVLDREGFEFPHAVTSEGVRAYKPDPRIFLSALAELDLPPSRVLHVGDSPGMDVLGARNVRMRCAWVNRRGRILDDHVPHPDLEVADLMELAGHLEV